VGLRLHPLLIPGSGDLDRKALAVRTLGGVVECLARMARVVIVYPLWITNKFT
jgi:hypothetical protein